MNLVSCQKQQGFHQHMLSKFRFVKIVFMKRSWKAYLKSIFDTYLEIMLKRLVEIHYYPEQKHS